jgi:ATP-dependent helicase YprA (DUF1998 family)
MNPQAWADKKAKQTLGQTPTMTTLLTLALHLDFWAALEIPLKLLVLDEAH